MQVSAKQFFSDASASFDPSSESAFFSGLKMRNGTFKQTSPSRFDEIEAHLAEALAPYAPDVHEVLDVGMSTGQTTAELVDFLSVNGVSANVTGTDLFIDAHLIELGSWLSVLSDTKGWPLQYGFRGHAIRAWTRRLDYFTLAAIPRSLARKSLQGRLLQKISQGQTRPVKMVCRALLERDISLVENDIFSRTPVFEKRFDFVRAANILNKGYFPVSQLNQAIANIKLYSRGPGALLLVVRTTDGENHGTLFRLTSESGYEVVTKFGDGSEIEDVVLSHANISEAA